MTNAKSIELLRKLITIREKENELNSQLLDEIQETALPGQNDTIGNILIYRKSENNHQIGFLIEIIDCWRSQPENTAPGTFDLPIFDPENNNPF